ncbi:MAG: DUF6478 family protein [Pseudomonadota bacterium]
MASGVSDWQAQRARRWSDPDWLQANPRVVAFRDQTDALSRATIAAAGPARSGLRLSAELGLHHDGDPQTIALGLALDRGEEARTGLAIALAGFQGSYFSVTCDLPTFGPAITRSSVVSVWARFNPPETAPALRLNLHCGVNLEQPPPTLTWLPDGVLAEFEFDDLPPAAPSRGWVDLLFPPMRHGVLRLQRLHLAHWLRLEI